MSIFEEFIESEKRDAVGRALIVAQNPYIFGAIKNWDYLGVPARKDFITHYVRQIGGLIDLEFYSEASAEGIRSHGWHSNRAGWLGQGVIAINEHPDVLLDTPLIDILDTPPHELAHRRQYQIMADPKVLPEEFAEISPILKTNSINYISGKTNYTAYCTQPMERHAFAVGEVFAQTVLDFVRSHEFVPNYFDEKSVLAEYEKVVHDRSFMLGSGYIYIPQVNYSDNTEYYNTYRHYHQARLYEERIIRSVGKSPMNDWCYNAVLHYALALRCGEYLIRHNPVPAVAALGRFAENMLLNDQCDVPAYIQKIAQRHIFASVNSQRAGVRGMAKLISQRLLKKDQPSLPITASQSVEAATANM